MDWVMGIWDTSCSGQAAWLWVGSEVPIFHTQHRCPSAECLRRQGRLCPPPCFSQLCCVFSERLPLTGSNHTHNCMWTLFHLLPMQLLHILGAGTLAMWICWSLQCPTGPSFNWVFNFWSLKDAETFGLQTIKVSLINNYSAFFVCTFEATSKAQWSGAKRTVPLPKTWVISCGADASGLQVMSSESKCLPEGQLGANELSTLPEGHDFWGLINLTSQEMTLLCYEQVAWLQPVSPSFLKKSRK